MERSGKHAPVPNYLEYAAGIKFSLVLLHLRDVCLRQQSCRIASF